MTDTPPPSRLPSLMRRRYTVLLGLAALPLAAQVSPTGAVESGAPDPVVVTVTASPIPLSTTSASVTVISRAEIEASRAESAIDLLRQTPLLHISQTGGKAGLATVTLRGGDPNFTLVMVDGIPVNDLSNLLGGSFDFTSLSTDNIEQIEIVRGPMSALYGSDAMAGVINIVSRRGSDKRALSVSASGGRFGTLRGSVHTAGRAGRFDYSLGASWQEVGEQVEQDSMSLGTVSFRSGVALGATRQLEFTARYHDIRTSGFPDNGGGPEFSLLREPQRNDARDLVLGAGFRHAARPWWVYSIDFDWFDRSQFSRLPAILDSIPPSFQARPPFDNDTQFSRTRLSFVNSFTLGGNWTANLGVQAREESGSSDSLIAGVVPAAFRLDRTNLGAAGEIAYTSHRFSAAAGLRADRNDGFPSEYSPRVGASYRLSDRGPRLKATWGEGYKLPSFFALGEPNVGNPNLRPEHSRGFDAGIEQRFGTSGPLVSLSYFRNRFQDLIDFSPSEFRLVNRSVARTQGVELEARLPLGDRWALGGHLTWLDWALEGTDEPLRDRPRWRGGSNLTWRVSRQSRLRWDTLWVGPRFDFQIPVPGRDVVGGYSTTSVVYSYDLPHGLTAFARADNLFNARFHEFIGFPNPGIWARVGLTYRVLGN